MLLKEQGSQGQVNDIAADSATPLLRSKRKACVKNLSTEFEALPDNAECSTPAVNRRTLRIVKKEK